jgi:hypothetical protein
VVADLPGQLVELVVGESTQVRGVLDRLEEHASGSGDGDGQTGTGMRRPLPPRRTRYRSRPAAAHVAARCDKIGA